MARGRRLIVLATVAFMAWVAHLNLRFSSKLASGHTVEETPEHNRFHSWAATPDAAIATFLRPPPPWILPPPRDDLLSPLSSSGVTNATLERLHKVASARATMRATRRASVRLRRSASKISARPFPEVSPLLFGGFIEHMGRTIDGNFGNDGGIWAEALADRKFFFPLRSAPGAKTRSPWLASSGNGVTVGACRCALRFWVEGRRL